MKASNTLVITNDALSGISLRFSPGCMCICVFRAERRVKRFAHTALKSMAQFELNFKYDDGTYHG